MDGEELGLLDGAGEAAPGDDGGQGDESFIEETPGDEGSAGGDGGEGGGESEHADEEDLSEAGRSSRAIVKLNPLEVRKALREVGSANPEFTKKFPTLEKAVTTALFKSGQVDKLGGLQTITQALEAIEVHGGLEGIQEIADELEEHRALEKGFEQGDSKIIDGWAKDYPNGFRKLILPALEKLESLDQEHSDAVVSFVTNRMFERCGVYSAFSKLGDALKKLEAGKDQGSIDLYNEIAKFLGDMRRLSGNARTGRTDRDSELETEREDLAKSKRQMIYSSARADVNPKIMYEMNRLIRLALPRGTKVKVDQANRLRKEIQSETRARMNSESDFAANFEALLKAGNKDRLAKFIYARAAKHLPKVVRQLLNEFGLMKRAAGGGTSSGSNGSGARRSSGGNGSSTVTGRPKTSEIDFSKTDKSYWLANMNGHGSAWLLNGKQAKW